MLGVAETPEASLEATERPERVSESQAKVDALLYGLPSLRARGLERRQRLLEQRRDRLLVGRAGKGSGSCRRR